MIWLGLEGPWINIFKPVENSKTEAEAADEIFEKSIADGAFDDLIAQAKNEEGESEL